MRKEVRHRYDAYFRVQHVCAAHSELLDGTPGGQNTRAALGTLLGEVDRLLAVQEHSTADGRAATKECRQCRRALRAAAKAVVSVGKVVNLTTPIMDTMQLPDATNDKELLAYSRQLLERVSAHADAFVAQGLPPDLLTRLRDRIAAFEAARETQASSRQRFTAAFESILDTLDQTDNAVDVLEAIVLNTPAAPAEVLNKLRIARRVGPRVIPTEPKPPQAVPTDKAA